MLFAKKLSKAIFFAGGKMKKLKVLTALLAGAAIFLVSCASDSGSDDSVKPEVAPGTVGEAADELLAAADLLKEVDQNDEKTILFYYREDGKYADWALWLWENGGNGELAYSSTIGKFKSKNITYNEIPYNIGYMELDSEMFADSAPLVKKAIEEKATLNFIIRDAEWNKDPGTDQAYDLAGGSHFMVISGDKDVYPVSTVMTPFISSASMETLTTMKVTLSVKYALESIPSANGFKVVATDGTIANIADVLNYNSQDNRSNNFTNTILVKFESAPDFTKNWKLYNEKFEPVDGREISTQNAVKISLNDYKYEGDDLGLTISGEKATFKVWAPIASDVKILFYDDVSKVGNFKAETVALNVSGSTTEESLKGEPSGSEQMILDKDSGIWSYTLDSIRNKKYYKYQITNNGTVYYVADIYAKSCSPDSIASQIVDINADGSYGTKSNYVNPFGANGTSTKEYTDAVIYEMHIRDWSRAVNPTSTGKFNDMCSDEIIAHLKDLGITHVQILPMFDYAQVNADSGYNWGYNPYHYNVPEGRYTDYSANPDGTAAVEQMRAMIKKFHDAKIAVIMDVVYNHTSGTAGGSLYDSTVPYYYYRLNSDGTYSNGSGCGNETDSEAPMFRKYMIDTLKHWMLDYHINGFRFDLMELHSKEAMAEIYRELSSIDKNVMVYGEPWTGGDAAVKDGAKTAIETGSYGVGAFDDDFRDAIKGAEYGGLNLGQIQGIKSIGDDGNFVVDSNNKVVVTYNDDGIIAGLRGKSGKNNRNTTDKLGLALHYAECHDNYTLFDKLVYTLDENFATSKKADSDGKIATTWPATITKEQLELIKKEDKLAAAYVLLSQGTPFINGGQEFLRTKKGNPDSYSADTKGGVAWTNTPGEHNIDDVNTIDLSMKSNNKDVYDTYKGLIALRKDNPSVFGKSTDALATKAKVMNSDEKEVRAAGVTKYTTGDFLVYFNATDSDVKITTTRYTKSVDVSSGVPKDVEIVSTVPAKSFVILKK